MESKCIISAAGSGKTTYIINKSLESNCEKEILITTFTRENRDEIKRKIYKIKGAIPSNITVQTWWSFLLQHGVRPYQNAVTKKEIRGLLKVENRSGVKYLAKSNAKWKKSHPVYFKRDDADNYYLSPKGQIFSDKIADFVITANKKSNGEVFKRCSEIFDLIFIDEVQDLAGYDLEIVHEILKRVPTTLVGDPRQTIYYTHTSPKYRKYKEGKIDRFIEDNCAKLCKVDKESLQNSFRCNSPICNYSSTLFPELPSVTSCSQCNTGHDGVFWVSKRDVPSYLEFFSPVQLRYSRRTAVDNRYPVYNWGESKGLTFDRVIIYPTATLIKFLRGEGELKGESLHKYYVALTRARYSVAIIEDSPPCIGGISRFKFR